MATVHRAEVVLDGEVHAVALKRLLPELARNTSFVRRFVDEARLGQRLRHVNIAKTLDVGCIDEMHYIAFEYVRGPTVLGLLRHSNKRGPLPIHVALHIIKQVARALAYAHGVREDNGDPLRVIHRDIAPSNIIVSETGTTKLIDFGVAKTDRTHVRTGAGSVIGKLGYVAPEYLAGRLDARVDLYSLGVVAYELLTAKPLFKVEDINTAKLFRMFEIDPPSKLNPCVPAELDDIVLTALQCDPELRWQNAFALFTALSNMSFETGLEVTDRDVAEWIAREIGEPRASSPEPDILWTSEMDIDVDLEEAFYKITDGAHVLTPAPGM